MGRSVGTHPSLNRAHLVYFTMGHLPTHVLYIVECCSPTLGGTHEPHNSIGVSSPMKTFVADVPTKTTNTSLVGAMKRSTRGCNKIYRIQLLTTASANVAVGRFHTSRNWLGADSDVPLLRENVLPMLPAKRVIVSA